MTTEAGPGRREVLAGAALQVLGEEGARGLTHRAVDVRAGLPQGSVNYYVKTREQLLLLAAEELFRRDVEAARGAGSSSAGLAADLAGLVGRFSTGVPRTEQLARFELLLEARRRPVVREVMDRQRATFVSFAGRRLAGTGCASPAVHADGLVALFDGLVLRQLLQGPPLTRPQVEEQFALHLTTC